MKQAGQAEGDAWSPDAPISRETLVIDLDGTLIRSDLLYETFWATLARERWGSVFVLGALARGRAALKRRLMERGLIDVTTLPYNEDVLGYVRRWRDEGGRTALVSASDDGLVRAVATHLGLFDDVAGSDGATNLKGSIKARFLTEKYGKGGFAYIGDARADLPVWRNASRAITVDASPKLREAVAAVSNHVEHLITRGSHVRPLLRALRPHQWLKNALVFLPLLAAHQFEVSTITRALLAFASFSLVASSMYLANDLLDLAADRSHARKRLRPFASGALPLSLGTVLAPLLTAAGLLIGFALGAHFVLVMIGYVVVTTAYSVDLKRRLIIDICTLAILYTIRIVAGGAATEIPISVWLMAFSIFFFFFLAAIKRQSELVATMTEGRQAAPGRGYRVSDLPVIATMAVASGYVSVLIFALYLSSDSVIGLYSWPSALWGICLVLIYWISRVVLITHRGWMHDDPVVFAMKDRISLMCLIMIVLIAGAAVMFEFV